MRRGHLTARELIENGVTVHDVSRRNGNFRVVQPSGDGLLIKQAREANAIRTVAWEGRMYGAFQALSEFHPLRHYTVPFLEYDADEGVLLLRCIRQARSLAARQNAARFAIGPAAHIGSALAALHNTDFGASLLRSEALPRHPPHALYLHRPDHMHYYNASSGSLQMVRLIQSFPDFGGLIDDVTEGWRVESLIHFDAKGDNVLLCSMTGARSVWLIDWEMAGLGDAAWDIGSILADYLGVWLAWIPITGEDSPADYLSLARFPLITLQSALRAFWKSYRLACNLNERAASAFLLSATRYAAVRLIQRVYEQARDEVDLAANDICQLQLRWNILSEPEIACVRLLGLDLISPEGT